MPLVMACMISTTVSPGLGSSGTPQSCFEAASPQHCLPADSPGRQSESVRHLRRPARCSAHGAGADRCRGARSARSIAPERSVHGHCRYRAHAGRPHTPEDNRRICGSIFCCHLSYCRSLYTADMLYRLRRESSQVLCQFRVSDGASFDEGVVGHKPVRLPHA